MKSIRQLIHNLKGWIAELGEKRKELLAQKAAEEATLLPNLLMKYMEIRLSLIHISRAGLPPCKSKISTPLLIPSGMKLLNGIAPAKMTRI